jgi:hypothetical protein
VTHIYIPSYTAGLDRRASAKSAKRKSQAKNVRPYLKIAKAKKKKKD